jgi:hypothetical protein
MTREFKQHGKRTRHIVTVADRIAQADRQRGTILVIDLYGSSTVRAAIKHGRALA